MPERLTRVLSPRPIASVVAGVPGQGEESRQRRRRRGAHRRRGHVDRRVLLTLVPIRPRSRSERRFLRTFSPVVSLRPGSLDFNERPPSTPFNSTPDAYQLRVFRECRDEEREGRIRVDRERRRRRAGRDVGGGFASAHVDVAVEPERQDVVRGLDLGGHDAPAGLPAPRRAAYNSEINSHRTRRKNISV